MAKESLVRGNDPKSTDPFLHGNASSVLQGGQGAAVETDFYTNGEARAGFQRRPDIGREAAAKSLSKDHQIMDSDGSLRQKPNPVTELRDHRFNNAYESRLNKVLPRESVKLPPRSAVLRNEVGSRLIDRNEPSAKNCPGKNDCCVISPVNSGSNG